MLLYGFGSKRTLLERFAAETLLDGGVLAVNGLFPGLSARALLLRVASALRLPRHAPVLVGYRSLGGLYSHIIRTHGSSWFGRCLQRCTVSALLAQHVTLLHTRRPHHL